MTQIKELQTRSLSPNSLQILTHLGPSFDWPMWTVAISESMSLKDWFPLSAQDSGEHPQ